MSSSFNGSSEQLLREIENSAIRRISLGIAQLKNNSEPIYILPPLVKLPPPTFNIDQGHIPLKRKTPDTPNARIAVHPVFHLASYIGCLPSLNVNLNTECAIASKPRCGWLTSDTVAPLPLLQPTWLAQLSKDNYTLIHGYRTYRTFLRQDEENLFATVWTPPTKKVTQSDLHAFLEFSTRPALIDVLSTSFSPELFKEQTRAHLIFWLDTLGLLPLLFNNPGKNSSKHTALATVDLPESTYNLHTRDFRKRQRPLPSPPTPSPDNQKRSPREEVASTTVGADSGGPAMTSTDDEANTKLSPEEKESSGDTSDDGPKWDTPPL